MYHAPVPLEVDPQELEPAELADESVGADASSEKLRDAHLHNGQAQTRAPLRALFRAHRRRRGPAHRLGDVRLGPARADRRLGSPWSASPTGPRCRRAMDAAALRRAAAPPRAGALVRGDRRGGRPRRALGRRFPPTPSPPSRRDVQVVIGGAMAAMIMRRDRLAAVPAAAIAWIATLTAAFCVAYYLGSASLDPSIGARPSCCVAGGRASSASPG